jgi:hypothetical protein
VLTSTERIHLLIHLITHTPQLIVDSRACDLHPPRYLSARDLLRSLTSVNDENGLTVCHWAILKEIVNFRETQECRQDRIGGCCETSTATSGLLMFTDGVASGQLPKDEEHNEETDLCYSDNVQENNDKGIGEELQMLTDDEEWAKPYVDTQLQVATSPGSNRQDLLRLIGVGPRQQPVWPMNFGDTFHEPDGLQHGFGTTTMHVDHAHTSRDEVKPRNEATVGQAVSRCCNGVPVAETNEGCLLCADHCEMFTWSTKVEMGTSWWTGLCQCPACGQYKCLSAKVLNRPRTCFGADQSSFVEFACRLSP